MIMIREPKEGEIEKMYYLRWKVLREPLGLPRGSEIGEREDRSIFFIAVDDTSNRIIGTVRLALGTDRSADVFDVAVEEEYRMKGVGRKLMEALHQTAKQKGVLKLKLSAREAAQKFYEKLGYVPKGKCFISSVSRLREIKMERML